MREEDYARLEQMEEQLTGLFGRPVTPEAAIPRVLVVVAALRPLNVVTMDPQLVNATAEWLTPDVADSLDQVITAASQLYDLLESAVDEVTIMEPGSMSSQQLVDMPTRAGRPAADGRPPGARGDLIR